MMPGGEGQVTMCGMGSMRHFKQKWGCKQM